jgi:hypothetical protein
MCKRLFGFLIVAFFLLSGHAWAAPPCTASQPVYISSGTQILCVETASGANSGKITVLLTDSSSVFQDIAFGPDGLLYFTDSLGARVFRFDPASGAASAVLVANIPSGTPTGLSFSSSNGTSNGDLYVNSSAGVWKIAGIASSVSPVTPPVSLTNPVISFSPSITVGGNAFDVFSEVENLVIVDQTNNQILQSAPPFTSATFLTSVPSAGPGIFANFCGDLLVASGTTVQRLSLTFSLDKNGNLVTTASPSTLVNFGKGNAVQYFEVAADNTVLAATFSNGAGGIVWRVDPVKDATGVPSCSATPSTTPLVSLKSALQAKTPPDLASNIAKGVALAPTSISISANFDATHPSQVYNFGLHKLSVTYKQVLAPFSQRFTAVRSRPADISFTGTDFPSNTVPLHFSPFGGFAIQYATLSTAAPVAGKQYTASTPGTLDAIQFTVSFSTQDFLSHPGVARAKGYDVLLTAPTTPVTYTDDVTHDFWLADDTGGAGTDGWSEYVVFNEALKQNTAFSLKNPVASCGTTTTPTCNPQFTIGQSVRFAFNLTPSVSNAIARLSIAKVHVDPVGTIQILQTIAVFSKNNSNVDNFFSVGNNLYTYDWDSSGAAGAGPGLYQATIFSDSFAPPQVVFLTLK